MRLALATLLLLACTTGRGEPAVLAPLAPTVAIHNDNFADVTAYALRSGQRFRLGYVRSMTTATYELPDTPNPIRVLVVTFASGEQFATEELVVRAGQRLEVTVAGMVSLSSYMLRAS